jgi:hypothetical protein
VRQFAYSLPLTWMLEKSRFYHLCNNNWVNLPTPLDCFRQRSRMHEEVNDKHANGTMNPPAGGPCCSYDPLPPPRPKPLPPPRSPAIDIGEISRFKNKTLLWIFRLKMIDRDERGLACNRHHKPRGIKTVDIAIKWMVRRSFDRKLTTSETPATPWRPHVGIRWLI